MKKLSDIKFYQNTDTVDIDAKSLGISSSGQFDDRGLSIMIRHNRDKHLFELANQVSKKIVQALNPPEGKTVTAGMVLDWAGDNPEECLANYLVAILNGEFSVSDARKEIQDYGTEDEFTVPQCPHCKTSNKVEDYGEKMNPRYWCCNKGF